MDKRQNVTLRKNRIRDSVIRKCTSDFRYILKFGGAFLCLHISDGEGLFWIANKILIYKISYEVYLFVIGQSVLECTCVEFKFMSIGISKIN